MAKRSKKSLSVTAKQSGVYDYIGYHHPPLAHSVFFSSFLSGFHLRTFTDHWTTSTRITDTRHLPGDYGRELTSAHS